MKLMEKNEMQNQQMTVENALQLVDQVCAQFQGNRNDHINLQVAVLTLRNALNVDEDSENPTVADSVDDTQSGDSNEVGKKGSEDVAADSTEK